MQRDKLIDGLKGYAIFLVVWGHSIQNCGEGIEVLSSVIGKYIYLFHMPLFFFMSAFVGGRTLELSFKGIVKKKVRQLLWPLCVFSFLQFILTIISLRFIYHIPMGRDKILDLFCIKMAWSYWFLIVLFLCFAVTKLSYLISDKIKCDSGNKTTAVLFLTWLCSFLIPGYYVPFSYYLTLFQGMYPFFIFGLIFQKYKIVGYIKDHPYLILSMTLPLFIILIFWFDKEDFIYSINNYDIWVPDASVIKIICEEGKILAGGMVGTIFTISLFSLIRERLSVLIAIGKETLGIYLFQAVIFANFIFPLNLHLHNNLYYLILSIVITAACYYLSIAFKKTKIGNYVFGKSRTSHMTS